LFSEAWSSIRMNLSTTVAATMTVLIGMCLLGLFIALGTWVLSWSNHVQKELEVKVYFCTSVVPQPGCKTGATKAQEQAVAAVFIQRLFTAYLPPVWGWATLAWMRRREYV